MVEPVLPSEPVGDCQTSVVVAVCCNDDVQDAKRRTVVRAFLHEVLAPHMIWTSRLQPDAGTVIQPQPPALGLINTSASLNLRMISSRE